MIMLNDISFEQLLLDEIGLQIYDGKILDQDTMEYLSNHGHNMTYQDITNIYIHKDVKSMNALFMYFCNKISKEQNIYVDVVYYKQVKNSRNSPLAVRANGKELISKIYENESLKYLDLICQLNGAEDVDLSRFDSKWYIA